MYFVVLCEDKDMSGKLRSRTRPAHLQYLQPYRDKILLAGPLLQDGSEESAGGLIIIDLPDYDAAVSFAQNDPYALAGLFARIEVRAWRKVIPA